MYVRLQFNRFVIDTRAVSENGSGGMMSDITFRGGNFGFCESLIPIPIPPPCTPTGLTRQTVETNNLVLIE